MTASERNQAHFQALCGRYGKCTLSRSEFEKAMLSAELKLERLAEQACNITDLDETEQNEIEAATRETILNAFPEGRERLEREIYFNRDPRGFAIKLHIEPRQEIDWRLHRDWGDYVILAKH